MQFTYAAVRADGRVDHLRQDVVSLHGLHCMALPEPLAAWPEQPNPRAELWLDAQGLRWQDPRTTAELAAAARAQRDALLAATDWRVTRAMELGTAVPADWATYRQQLRDVPLQPTFPDPISWPPPPET